MKKVLVVAHQFPPVGGAGVQRTLKFSKFLPDHGWKAVVLTRDDGRMTLRDETMLAEIPQGTEILRTPAWDLTVWPSVLAKVGKFIAWKLLSPDGEALWMRGARRAAAARAAAGDIPVVYTTSAPYSDHLVGLALRRRFPDIRWVADFRDEWMNNPYLLDHPHMQWRMKREAALEQAVLREADHLVTNSPGMKANFVRNHPGIGLETRMSVIPNGYDPSDFEALPPKGPKGDRFSIVYTGGLYGRRKPDLFLEAVGSLVRDGLLPKARIHLKFIGSYKPEVLRRLVSDSGLDGSVTLEGYMDHGACLREMTAADALLLLEGAGPGAEAFFTGKVFEYIHARRPVLAVVPEKGAAAGVVRETRTGVVCSCVDREAIRRGVLDLFRAWEEDRDVTDPDWDAISVYDRRNLTARLAAILDDPAGASAERIAAIAPKRFE